WMRSEGFNITGKAPEGTPVTAMGPLLESLLAERFQLTFHREKRELPVYALVTARSSELQWTPDQLPPRAPGTPADQPIRVNGVDIDPNGPSLFTALQEQLGVKLDSTRGPVEVMVIDRLERPSPD
ncbi:MAG TPA: TIGR03435 family protein, partial [Vicinamibacterales bacterium]|nr:TIGR03435 family protein [Vicinamibacterales bacterium]